MMQNTIKLVLVDDEQMALNMLKNLIPWNTLHLELAGTASDGKMMLDMLKSSGELPDMIITDIRMPNMDGLEMVQKIREINSNIKIILSSAFSDFAYVKEGLKLGCSDYLLKPIDEKELIRALKKVIGEIEGEKVEKRILEQSAKQLFRMDLYKYMCSGKRSENLDTGKERHAFLNTGYLVLYIHKDYTDFDEYLHTTSMEMFKEHFVEGALDEVFSKQICRDYVFYDYDEEGWILIIQNDSQENMPDICALISSQIQEKLQLPVHQYFSMIGKSIEDLPLCFRQVKRMQKYAFSFEDASYLGYDYNCDKQKLEEIRKLEKTHRDGSDAVEISRPSSYSRTVEKSLDYIQSHYNQNLSLEEICMHVAVSKNYFCYLFKREVGQSLWNYLTKIRLEQAKKLLEETDMKTYEISFEVGYDNPNYFSKVFRKYCNLSPNEYRRELGR